jgi:hypothetical protein
MRGHLPGYGRLFFRCSANYVNHAHASVRDFNYLLQRPHFIRDNGKTPAVIAGTGCFNRRVQGQKVCHAGDFFDRCHNLSYLPARLTEFADSDGGILHGAL